MMVLKEKDHAELHAGLSKLDEKSDESGSFISSAICMQVRRSR
jgi:hypothetical protein